MLLNCGIGEDSWESLGLQGDPASPSYRKSVLNIRWKDWCWSWNSNTLATWCEKLTHLKRHWCWERLRTGGEGDNRRGDDWMAPPTRWTWVWASSGSWWRTGKPGVLQSVGSQIVRHDWANELNWLQCIQMSNHYVYLWNKYVYYYYQYVYYYLTCLLRNLYASQEATVRTGHGTTDRFQIRKGVHQGCKL